MGLQFLFAPKIKQQPIDQGKMDDIRIQGSDYGSIIPRTWGKTRQAGLLVFSSGIDHYTTTTGGNGGGKKNPGTPQTINHIYKTSVGIVICRNRLDSFVRIWADSEVVVDNSEANASRFQAEDATLSGGASVYIDLDASEGEAVENLGNGGKVTFDVSSIPDPPEPPHDPDETADQYTVLSFYYKTPADRNATIDTDVTSPTSYAFLASTEWTVHTIRIDGFANSVSFENAAAAAPNLDQISVQKYWFVIYRPDNPDNFPRQIVSGIVNPNIDYPKAVDDPSEYYNYPVELTKDAGTGIYAMQSSIPGETIRFYSGTETQTSDAKIKSWLDGRYGTGQGDLRASAMRGLSYVLFQDRTLKSSRIENFTFETDAGFNEVNDILEDLFEECGLETTDYLITATNGLSQVGFIDHRKQSRKTLVEYLARYHGFRIGEIDGKLTTILDSFVAVGSISSDSLRAHEYGSEMPRFDAQAERKENHLLPREVRVSVMQPELEYHNESVPAMLFANISGKESKEYSFPIVDPGANARLGAEKLLLKEHSEDTAFEYWGMPENAKWAVGDVVTLPINGVNYNVRIEKKQLTLPIGKIKFQVVGVNPFTPTQYQADVTPTTPISAAQRGVGTWPRNSIAFVIQGQPVRECDRGRLGVYVALCGRGHGVGNGITLYRELSEDNYVSQIRADAPSPVGLCEDTLANHAGGTATEDTTNVLDIWFFDNIDLETVTQDDIDRHPHINLIRVGSEWIQFRTATVQTLEDGSPYRSKWRISNLWRGRYGTSAAISTHAAGEYAAVYDANLQFYELETADIGESVNIKAVTSGQAIDVAPITSFTFSQTSAYSVSNGSADRNFDANNTSLNELADVVATVIEDLNL